MANKATGLAPRLLGVDGVESVVTPPVIVMVWKLGRAPLEHVECLFLLCGGNMHMARHSLVMHLKNIHVMKMHTMG
jgi:hypothetical protein